MSVKKLIDPIDVNLTGNTSYEDLFIYVDMYAERRGFTVLDDNNLSTSESSTKVNLLGFRHKVNKSDMDNIFTTDYSIIYDNDPKDIAATFEGFGIKSINIETNASYVPKVFVDFVDIKGMSFFNKNNNSPYSLLFDFPPPIFTLVIKGYYGGALEYKLHLLKQNTKFDSETGNFNINAEFLGNTFAPLTDLLFQNVLLAPKLINEKTNISDRSDSSSLADLISKAKTIKNEIIQKIKDEDSFKELGTKNEELEKFRDFISKNLLEGSDVKLVKIIISDNESELNSFDTLEINNIPNNIDKNKIRYFIISKPIGNVINPLDIFGKSLLNFYNIKFNDYKVDVKAELNAEFITTPLSLRFYKIKEYNKLDYIDITETILNVKNEYDKLYNEYTKKYETINKSAGELIKNELGFTPTIYNVMNIILKDVGIWLNELINVYNESITYLNDNKQQFKNLYSNVTKFYPFPDFVDQNVKVFPDNVSDVRAKMPEIEFTKKFINEFVNRKKEQADKEKALISNITNNETDKWYPINYYNSITNSEEIVTPYINVVDLDNLFSILFSRYYIHRFFNNSTIPDNELFLVDNLTNNILFSKSEVENVLLSLDNKIKINLRDQFKNLKIENDVKIFIENKFKSFPTLDSILNGFPQSLFNIDNFEGIKFSNKKLIPKQDDLGSSLKGRRLYINNSSKHYKFSKKNNGDFGITLSENNDIYYYDGNSDDKTSFNIANVKLTDIKLNDIEDIIFKSMILNKFKDKIIANIIKLQVNNEDKLFGILNLIYVPNINHINIVLLNKMIIAHIPYLVKIFISSYVYDITNNNGINYNKIIGFGNNQSAILNNNFYTPLLDFKNRIINLSESDKNNFINFYNNQVLENFSNFELFINKFLDNNKFITKNSDIEKLIKDNINKIEFIKNKSLYINVSDNTFAIKNSDFFNNFSNDEIIKENLLRILNLKNKEERDRFEFTFISEVFKRFLEDFILKTNNLKLEVNIVDSEKTSIDKSFNSVKLETYYSIKSFVDRWMTPVEGQSNTNISTIFNLGKNNQSNNLIDLFSFVDRAYNESIAKTAIVDISILAEFENDYNVNMLTVIGKLLNENGFEFYPLQNFMVFNDDNNDWDSNNIFRPKTTDVNITNSEPKFTCIYVGGTSKYLDSLNNSESTFKNDGIDEFESATDFTVEESKTQGFRVRFGDGRQSVFTSIDVGTEEFQPTNESLEAMSLILDGAERTPVTTAQNLFSVYEQRSYTCKVKMFGNAMIQPTQFFMLENIPMFNGLYLILKVSHTIDGENNSIMTEFEGVRLPKEPRPFITQPYDVYIKNIIGGDLLTPNFKITENKSIEDTKDQLNFPKKDRTIYLIAGHDNNDPGAVVDGTEIRESDFTKEFRNLLKRELDNKSIKNDIDNDDLSLNQVITDLNTKINEDDIVIDIHFNAFGNNANGTEVVIKNAENDDIIILASKIANQIVKTLGTNLRRGGDNLPKGVISQSQTQKQRLAIFNNLKNNNVILIEICFIDNTSDRNKYNNNKELLAKNIVENILSRLSTTKNDTELDNLETFDILNELKYDKINNRPNPYILPNQNSAKNLMRSLFKNHDFNYTVAGSKIDYIQNSTGPFKANKPKTVYINNNEKYFNDIIKQLEFTSEKYKIDILLLFGIIAIESKFQPSAVSRTGAFGIGQFIISTAMLEILRSLQNKPNNTSKVLIFENNEYIEKTINNKEILNILFSNNDLTNIKFEEISSGNIKNFLKNKKVGNKSYAEILIQNIFDNPFISIDLSGLYLNIIENYVKTKQNKNLGVLTLSYNAGNKGNNYVNDERIYFNYIKSKYEKSTEENIKQLLEEGVLYPERLINEILIPLNIIGKPQSKSKVVI